MFTAEGQDQGVNVRVLRGSPTPEEIAAVTAVLTAAVVEEAARADAVPSDGPSAWQRSQRILRSPLQAGAGRWRNFSA
ncbi:acyl-CoA carboxylase subunit epsilon [Mycetocola manganoxydans]|uniref:Acyl-CoA carboxylase subunit epsilon n=1 Tax=Mycetocola manganoxydans TaxID=699879 RepID=A0A3L7A1L1_9MICO|nr:acyl-CoA carboxylase subunit epsilon [Mycetocola manganoxydans]